MNSNWWRSFEELDDDQKAFIRLPLDGKHSLEGPPGSGKTNLLLLRAEYLAGRGEKNVLILTFTKTLRNFIRSGISARKLIAPSQVMTYHAWARGHILHHLNIRMVGQGKVFDDVTRAQIIENLRNANERLDSLNQYSAIFVDEAQDLSVEELELLLSLSERICICGDSKQGIYHQDGLGVTTKLKLQPHTLRRHFRIGRRIAQVADRLLPPGKGKMSMEDTSNYDKSTYGDARADLHHCSSKDEQFAKMIGTIRLQLDAYDGETIGIFGCKNETLNELRERFDETDLADDVCFHGAAGENNFGGAHRIHVMTSHAAKGTEFRAVHLYGAEEYANHPFNRTRLAYTVVTRAKTALDAYVTGETSKALESAFAQETHFDPADLFN